MNFEPILSFVLWGNTTTNYLIALLMFGVFLIVFKIIQNIVLKKLASLAEKTPTDIDNTLISIVQNIRPGFYVFLAFYLAIRNLTLSDLALSITNWALIIWATYLAILSIQRLIDYGFEKKLIGQTGNTAQAIKTLGVITKGILWVIGVLFILSNLGVNITSAVAGLGIGGVAIALALQKILGDLFSSFAIYFDKPFEVGDFIIVGDKMGTVEKIGIKTTRMRALQGEEIVISNQELTSAQIQNFKKLKERRVVFSFGVTYNTPNEKLKKIPVIIKEIFNGLEMARLDRAHFYRFDESALTFEVVYFVASGDYNQYMDTQEKINLDLKENLEKEKISMAFPTTTVHLFKEN